MPLPVAFDFTEGKKKISFNVLSYVCVRVCLNFKVESAHEIEQRNPQPTGFVVARTC